MDCVCFYQKTLLGNCPGRVRGYEVWEEKGFISSSGASVVACEHHCSARDLKATASQKKPIFALVCDWRKSEAAG